MNDYTKLAVIGGLVAAIFFWLWRSGQLARLTRYVQETKEELRKCTWPTWDELKGHTAIVMVAIVLLGLFTVAIDFVLHHLVNAMVQL